MLPAYVQASLRPRLPTWQPGEPLVERVLRAMWQLVNTYRLATEEKLDETPGALLSLASVPSTL